MVTQTALTSTTADTWTEWMRTSDGAVSTKVIDEVVLERVPETLSLINQFCLLRSFVKCDMKHHFALRTVAFHNAAPLTLHGWPPLARSLTKTAARRGVCVNSTRSSLPPHNRPPQQKHSKKCSQMPKTASAPSLLPTQGSKAVKPAPSAQNALQNALIINAVPFLWGSYSPAIKIMNQVQPTVPTLVVNLLCFLFAQAAISLSRTVTNDKSALPVGAGVELGCYLFAGSLLNLAALSYTSAPRCAFMVQLTTVFVPLLQRLRGEHIAPAIWKGCAIATCGALVLAKDAFVQAANLGDVLSVLAAVCYSVHVVRLDAVWRRGSTLSLVDAKTRTQVALAALCVVLFSAGDNLGFVRALLIGEQQSWRWWVTTVGGAAWVGGCTTSAATFLQVEGQGRVGATRAAVFYACQPVWAAFLSVALQVDSVRANEVIGGAMIVGASALVAASKR